MSKFKLLHGFLKPHLTDFKRDSRGTSAIEFALLLPIMLFIFYGTIEVSKLYIEKNQVEAISETVADLVTQGKTITTDQLEDIFKISTKALNADMEAKVNIAVTAVRTLPDENGQPETKVTWSESKTGQNTKSEDSTYSDLPDDMAKNYETIIVTELYYTHRSIYEFFIKGDKSFDRRFLNKPRYSSDIPCTDC